MIAAICARKSTDDSDRNEEARSTTRVERATEYALAKGVDGGENADARGYTSPRRGRIGA
jgi:hypothetical protein